jgi:tetratricopeptide (TPR) repeat protein
MLAVILVLTAGIYVQVWQHTLVWDEHTLTTQQVITHLSWATYQRSVQETYRPLALLSLSLDQLIWRGWPPGFAVDSLVYHLLVVALVFLLARRWLNPFPAVTAALIVALHPVGAEAVSYLLGRPDILSAACLVAALLIVQKPDVSTHRMAHLALFWCVGLLALAAKITALLLPILAFWVTTPETTGTEERHRSRLYQSLAVGPFVLLFVLYVAARVAGWALIEPPMALRITPHAIAMMASTSLAALKVMFWPSDLCPWYEGRIDATSFPWLAAGLLGVAAIGVIAAVWRLRRVTPLLSLGLTWVAGMIVLIAVRAAADPAPMNPLAVRWLYPAIVGLALAVGGLMQLIETGWPLISRLGILCLLVLFAGLNWQAQMIWQNDLSMFGRAIQCSPHSPLITLQYAALLERHGRTSEARQLRSQLAREQPSNPLLLSYQIDDAITHGDDERALVISRHLVEATHSFNATRRLADLELLMGEQDNAIGHYQQALHMQPDDLLSLTALGSLYERRHEWQNAVDLYSRFVNRHPTAANVWFRYGRVLEAQGQFTDAETSYTHVVELDPFCPDGSLALARLQERRGDVTAAAATRTHYTTLTHLPLEPRPLSEPTESPCGMEIKALYPRAPGQNPSVSH